VTEIVTQAAKGKLRPKAAIKAARFGGQTRYLWNLFTALNNERMKEFGKFVLMPERMATFAASVSLKSRMAGFSQSSLMDRSNPMPSPLCRRSVSITGLHGWQHGRVNKKLRPPNLLLKRKNISGD
jgi:hypothetical protein